MNNATTGVANARSIALVVITHNPVGILRQCVENVLLRTSPSTTEIVIWDNASTDGTRAYLDTLSDPRLTLVHHPKNIGTNGYAKGFTRTTAPYLVELDDDVTDAPTNWDKTLLDAFERIPRIGFLAADLEDDERDVASRLRHRTRAHMYQEDVINGVRILDGPTGGACAMTSREVYDRVGGFPSHRRKTFFLEDAEYIARIQRAGYRKAILVELRVHHQGDHYHQATPAKREYWRAHWKAAKRRNTVKKILLRIPFVPALSDRFGWIGPLEWEKVPDKSDPSVG